MNCPPPPPSSLPMESALSASESKIFLDFSRFVDLQNIARIQIKNAINLDEVVAIAHSYGFKDISVELFVKANDFLYSTDWAWKEDGRRWIDHVFMLSLATLTQDKVCEEEKKFQTLNINELSSDIVNAEDDAIAFYKHAKSNKDLQDALKQSKTMDEVINIARSHGFKVRKNEFIMNKHSWKDNFFPWANMSTQETREFMHA